MLTGSIPPILGNLTYTEKLYVHGNKLNGIIPSTFQSLESMTSLNLSSNNLQGSIPIELSHIGNLDTLDISNNELIGPIPPSLGDLEQLLKLNLSRNGLTGPILAEFGNLKSVMDIDLSHNQLSDFIPVELSQLQNIGSLRLEYDDLTGDVASLVICLSLSLLNVSYNNLVGLIPTNNNFTRFSPDSFIGNSGLCGNWLNYPCQGSHPTDRVMLSKAAILGITLGLGWQNTCENVDDITATLEALSAKIDISVLYRGLSPKSTHNLVSVVCYYGQHYHHFALSPNDDAKWRQHMQTKARDFPEVPALTVDTVTHGSARLRFKFLPTLLVIPRVLEIRYFP
ncbi:hypothetical protein KIW84_031882 [Lathyrus oleraceus]|uniref:Uncharacterized protein n=1 Tax=Pisum sativum TaxID=3888 RepID=A0A9D4XSF5_PEA|nr:hypothetical protein KIW84_031882 [Pisum sativum]